MEKDLLEKKSKGPLLLSNPYDKVQSRYLNSPTSSCHDLCKYGHKHECDDERNHVVFKRFMTNNTTSDAVQNHARGLNVSDGRKSSVLKLKASDKAKALEQNKRQEEKEDGRKSSEDHAMGPRSLFLKKKRIQLPQQTILQDSSVKVNQMRSLSSNKKKKKKQDTMKPNAASPVPERSSPDKLKASIEITSGDGPNILEMKVASYMRETATSSASKEDRQKKLPVGKLSGSSKSQSVEKNASVVARKIDGSAKRSISLKARAPLLRSVAQWNGGGNLQGSTNIRKITKEKSKNECMIIKDKNFSKESDGDSSESCVSELSEIEDVKMKQSCELSTTTTTTTTSCELSEVGKRRVRRTAAVKLHDTSSLPYKMKFQRGTVIDLRPTENIGLKRLKFRRGRELNKNSNGEITKRMIRRKDKGDMKVPSSAAHANSSEATAVILKHQDAQEKRNLRALFNHVIEETANKLVQTRKSKVKALVGAFETVISLQETKAAHLV